MKRTVSCTGKRSYRDFVTAREMARRTNDDRDGAAVGPYRCRQCQHWHVGNGHIAKHGRRPKVDA